MLGLISPGLVLTGALSGLGYGVLAAGIVLVYRASKVINFAHGQIGALCAAGFAKLVIDNGLPYAVGLPAALAAGAVLGIGIEALVLRRLRNSPRVVSLVATIGVTDVLLGAQAAIPRIRRVSAFPTPLHVSVHLGSTFLDSRGLMIIALVPAAVAGVTLFLRWTPTGVAVRAMADNSDAAELAGISTRRVAAVVWALAGGLAALTVVLLDPLLGVNPSQTTLTLGPGLLLRALAAALAARLVSLPRALVAGLVLGVGEACLLANVKRAGVVEIVLLIAVLVVVFAQRREVLDEGDSALTAGGGPPRLAALPWRVKLAAAAAAAAVPLIVTTAGPIFLLSRMLLYAVVGLSLVVLTGWGGQLSLCQMGFAGLGALVTTALAQRGVAFPAAVAEGVVAGVLAALAVGLPSLKVRGLLLATTTLAFAVAAEEGLFTLGIFGGPTGVLLIHRPALGHRSVGNGIYYEICLAVLLVSGASVARLRRTGSGRALVAVQANERRAAALTISPLVVKLTAFGFSGGLAALAGGIYAGLQGEVSASDYGVFASLTVVALVMIGGVKRPGGAVLGAVWVLGVPALFGHNAAAAFISSGAGLLVLLLYLPGGLISVFDIVLDRALPRPATAVAARPDRPSAAEIPASRRASPPAAVASPASGREEPLVLEARDVVVAFGGRTALAGVDLSLRRGEILGVIGANGAGKSTLLDVISGARVPDRGQVILGGLEVTGLPAHVRSRLGLGRSFQDASLFPDLTVVEVVALAMEASERSELIPSILALAPSVALEARHGRAARRAVDRFGLGPYGNSPIRDLSTGTRRVVEVAALAAQGAQVLLLDEPTAGLAQREAEAFVPLLRDLQAQLDASVVLIEHDIPLVMAVSDRLQCLSAGRTIATGNPEDVRRAPEVIAAYLGTDDRAISRSGLTGGGP